MIVLRKLPAMQPVLNMMILNKGSRDRTDHELNSRIYKASMTIFGLADSDTDFEVPHWVPDLPWEEWPESSQDRFNDAYDQWSAPFVAFAELGPDERLSFLARNGWDVRDDVGRPLECLSAFIRQIIHVCERRGGKSVEQIEAESWAASMAPFAGPNPQHIAQNKKFLDLGVRKPRTANDPGHPRPTRRAS